MKRILSKFRKQGREQDQVVTVQAPSPKNHDLSYIENANVLRMNAGEKGEYLAKIQYQLVSLSRNMNGSKTKTVKAETDFCKVISTILDQPLLLATDQSIEHAISAIEEIHGKKHKLLPWLKMEKAIMELLSNIDSSEPDAEELLSALLKELPKELKGKKGIFIPEERAKNPFVKTVKILLHLDKDTQKLLAKYWMQLLVDQITDDASEEVKISDDTITSHEAIVEILRQSVSTESKADNKDISALVSFHQGTAVALRNLSSLAYDSPYSYSANDSGTYLSSIEDSEDDDIFYMGYDSSSCDAKSSD